MNDQLMLPRDFNEQPGEYNYIKYMDNMKRALEIKNQVDTKIAIYLGRILLIIKENVLHGKLLETYEELGIEPWVAQNCMRLARSFGDNPDCLNEIGVGKALDMESHSNSGSIVQFKRDGIWKSPKGELFTHAEIVEMSRKEFREKITAELNQEKKDKNSWKNKAVENEQEMNAMQRDMKQAEDELRKMREDANPAMAEKIEQLQELKIDYQLKYEDAISRLGIKNERKLNGEEALKALEEMKPKIVLLCGDFNRIDINCGMDAQILFKAMLDHIGEYVIEKKDDLRQAIRENPEYN